MVMLRRSLINVDDYCAESRRLLPRMLYDFVDGAALDGQTRRRNSDGFSNWWLRGRSLRSASEIDLSVSLFGIKLSAPIFIAPTGASGLLWPRGEDETAKAAFALNIVLQVSAGSILSMEEIADAAAGPKWLQLFLYKDRGLTTEFLQRAKAAGYSAICVTTDAPVHGRRERDIRNGFTIDRRLSIESLVDAALHFRWWLRMVRQPRFEMQNFAGRAKGNMSDMATYIASVLNPDVTWDDFSWLRTQWDGPLVIKGILHPADALEALERGADAIQVSNHGGRQLDGTLASVDALPAIADTVGGRVPILFDGGVRRGTDVLKVLALGATACGIGRAHLWGLAVGGGEGVTAIVNILVSEMRNAMAIGGWAALSQLNRSEVTRIPVCPTRGENV